MTPRSIATVVICLSALASASCGGRPPMPSEDPSQLRPVADLGPDAFVRQRLVVRHGEQQARLEVVLQKRGDTLLLLALTPFGTRAFAIELSAAGVHFTDYSGGRAAPPFPPRVVLLDVQRTLAPWLARERESLSDGWHDGVRAGERIRELWCGGRLFERTFARTTGEPPGIIRVTYDGGIAPAATPPTIHLHNARYGYELELRTLEARTL